MPKKVSFDDLSIRLEEVKTAMTETKEKRLYERYQCIYLLLSGESRKSIARIINRGIDTIGTYVQAYSAYGLKGLELNHSPGRPTLLTTDQELLLYKTIVERTPVDVGFPTNMNWTSGLIRNWIKQQFDVLYSERGTRELLYRLGFSHTRPTYKLAKADPEKQELFKEEFEGLKKLHECKIDRILFEDESMIRDYQAIASTWFPKVQQKVIPTFGKHQGAKLLATVDYESGEIYWEEHEKYDAQVFLCFLENIVVKYPDGKTVMILDNARIHHAKLIQPFLQKHSETIRAVFFTSVQPPTEHR